MGASLRMMKNPLLMLSHDCPTKAERIGDYTFAFSGCNHLYKSRRRRLAGVRLTATLVHHVCRIVGRSPYKKMVGVEAGGVVARVQNECFGLKVESAPEVHSESMDSSVSPSVKSLPVALFSKRLLPHPASRCVDVAIGEQSFFNGIHRRCILPPGAQR